MVRRLVLGSAIASFALPACGGGSGTAPAAKHTPATLRATATESPATASPQPARAATPLPQHDKLGEVIANGAGMARMTAYGGHAVLSRLDPATKRWQLVQWHAGKLTVLPVPERKIAFDADAGSDAADHPVVVYSSCAADNADADFGLAKGCRVMRLRLDVRAAKPQRVSRADAPGYSATTPSMWHGNLAYSRRRDSADLSEVVYLERGATQPVNLAVPAARCHPRDGCAKLQVSIDALDLGATTVAFLATQSGGEVGGEGDNTTLRADSLDGSKRRDLVVGYGSGACGYVDPSSPTVVGNGAFWDAAGSPCERTATAFAEFRQSPDRRRTAREAPNRLLYGVARDGDTVYWLSGHHGYFGHDPNELPCRRHESKCTLVRASVATLPWQTVGPTEFIGPHPGGG